MGSSKRGRRRLKGGSKETMEEDGINIAKDMISELPDEILHKILAFLEAKEAARTSTLSKRWEGIWLSYPVVDFDETIWSTRKMFINYVERSLQQRSEVSIQKFKLCMENLKPAKFKISSRINSWIKSATRGKLEELDISMSANHRFIPYPHVFHNKCRFCYRLPQSIFTTKSLTVLKLKRCKLVPYDEVRLPCLKTLSLEETHAEEGAIQNLLSSSLIVETLILIRCSGMTDFHFSGVQLQTLVVEYPPKLNSFQIDGPNLQSISFSLNDYYSYPKRVQFTAARLRSLLLRWFTITDENCDKILDWPFLENLEIAYCKLPRKLGFYTHKLTSLAVVKCKNLVELEIDAPKLVSFIYTGEILQISHMNTSCKLQARLHLKPIALDSHWFSKLGEILGWFGHAQILTIYCKAHKIQRFIIPKELREGSVHPQLDLKHLQIMTSSKSIMNLDELIDSLIWIFPNLETLSLDTGTSCKTLKFQRDDLLKTGKNEAAAGEHQ